MKEEKITLNRKQADYVINLINDSFMVGDECKFIDDLLKTLKNGKEKEKYIKYKWTKQDLRMVRKGGYGGGLIID